METKFLKYIILYFALWVSCSALFALPKAKYELLHIIGDTESPKVFVYRPNDDFKATATKKNGIDILTDTINVNSKLAISFPATCSIQEFNTWSDKCITFFNVADSCALMVAYAMPLDRRDANVTSTNTIYGVTYVRGYEYTQGQKRYFCDVIISDSVKDAIWVGYANVPAAHLKKYESLTKEIRLVHRAPTP